MICPKNHIIMKSFHSFKTGGKRCNHNDCQYENMRDDEIEEYIEKEGYKIINTENIIV